MDLGRLMIELEDDLKDEDLATIWGASSPLYTHSVSISRDLAPGQISCLPRSSAHFSCGDPDAQL